MTTSVQGLVIESKTDQFHSIKCNESNLTISIISEVDHTRPVSAPYIGLTCLRACSSTDWVAHSGQCVLSLVNLKHLSTQAWFFKYQAEPKTGASSRRQAGLKLHPKTFFRADYFKRDGRWTFRLRERERTAYHFMPENCFWTIYVIKNKKFCK